MRGTGQKESGIKSTDVEKMNRKLKDNVAQLDISIGLFTNKLTDVAILPLYVVVTLYSIFTIATNQVLTNT